MEGGTEAANEKCTEVYKEEKGKVKISKRSEMKINQEIDGKRRLF